jgi:hypothetical protein
MSRDCTWHRAQATPTGRFCDGPLRTNAAALAEKTLGAAELAFGVARAAADRLERGCRMWRMRLAFSRVQRELGPMTGAVRPEQERLSYWLDTLQAEFDALRGGVAS